jgi:membrane protease subunit HflK
MAWNDSGNGKDPWKDGGEQANDLDQIVQNWQRKLSGIFGGGGGSKRSPSSGGGWVLPLILLIAWAFTGLYRVDEAQRGVVQRFGQYTVTTMPGLHWHMPFPIEVVDIVNTGAVDRYGFSTEILTADEQYVFIQMVVQYRREDPVKYSFEVMDPEQTIEEVTESALREVVGTNTLEDLVTVRRDEIAPATQAIVQNTLDFYGAGIAVSTISLERLDYPQAVQDAVDDTQKARNDSDRTVLEAEKYAQDLIPRARGTAARILQDAEAYRDMVIADAIGQSSRFLALLAEYQKAPEVTRERLYIEAVEAVYGNANKVILDADGGGNLLYLPLDKLMGGSGNQSSALNPNSIFNAQTPAAEASGASPEVLTDEERARRIRQ